MNILKPIDNIVGLLADKTSDSQMVWGLAILLVIALSSPYFVIAHEKETQADMRAESTRSLMDQGFGFSGSARLYPGERLISEKCGSAEAIITNKMIDPIPVPTAAPGPYMIFCGSETSN